MFRVKQKRPRVARAFFIPQTKKLKFILPDLYLILDHFCCEAIVLIQ